MREEQWLEIPDEEMAFEEPRNRQQIHEQDECPKRLIPCERRCGEFIAADKLEHHMQCLCIKRPFPPIRCRLGCGELFAGGAHDSLIIIKIFDMLDGVQLVSERAVHLVEDRGM